MKQLGLLNHINVLLFSSIKKPPILNQIPSSWPSLEHSRTYGVRKKGECIMQLTTLCRHGYILFYDHIILSLSL